MGKKKKVKKKKSTSASGYEGSSTHKASRLSPLQGKQTKSTVAIWFPSKEAFRRFCIDGLILCDKDQVVGEVAVTGHYKDHSVTTIGFLRKPKPRKAKHPLP